MRDITPQEAAQLAEEAYIYGYPLVLMEMTRRVMTHAAVPDPTTRKAPVGQFVHLSQALTPALRGVVSPNVDTLYSLAWLDLSAGPMVLSVPDTHGRYYLLPMLDAWTNVFAAPGSRTTGTGEGEFVVVGPRWHGTLPRGLKQISAPTNTVWIVGRTLVDGHADCPEAQAIQRGYRLTPLSAWGKPHAAPRRVSVDPAMEGQMAPVERVARMEAPTFFGTLAALLTANPPRPGDTPMTERLARLDLVPGRPFNFAALDFATRQALERAIPLARRRIEAKAGTVGERVNGWQCCFGLGRYGTDYLTRAAIASFGLGANLSADAICPYTTTDGKAKPLSGANSYVLHFAPGRTPPVNGFWSLTLYGPDHALVDNPIGRYAIGDRDVLRLNADGSLDLHIQHEPPGPGKEANWLPAPAGAFNLILRMYWPKPAVLNRTWTPPAVERSEMLAVLPARQLLEPSATP